MHPRSEWSAREPKSTSPLPNPRGLVIHWEGTTVGLTDPRRVPAQIAAIQRFHMDSRGFADIAYNYLIDPWGELWEGRGPGVRSGANGTDDSNQHDLAACVLVGIGDPPAGPPVFEAIARLRDELGLPIRGHRDVKPTACPGDDIWTWVHANGAPMPALIIPPASEVPMPYLMLHDPASEAIWALFPGGEVRHIGGAEWKFYESKDVEMIPVADAAEADRLKALVG